MENKEQKENERVPAPSVSEKKRKIWKRIGCIAGAALAVGLTFFTGMCACWFMIEPEMRTLINVKNMIDAQYYEEISDETFYEALFGVVNEDILDTYSGYMTTEEYAEATSDMDGNRIGLGLVFLTEDENKNPQMLITRVCGNSPAEAAGLQAGEYIVGFGKTQTQITDSESFEEFSSFLSEFGEGEEFYVKVRNAENERTVPLCRRAYVENYVFYRTSDNEQALTCLDKDTAYIRLIQFTGNAAEDFKAAMNLFKAQGKKNLVLDLRGNGGGYLDVMQEIAGYFCKNAAARKPVVAIADYGERREKFKASFNVYDEYFSEDSRICVLADRDTASASECLIGCMLDYGTITYGDICLTEWSGEAKTFGKGIMQTTYYVNVFKKDALKLTTAQIRWPVTDTCIHGRGVLASDGTKKVTGSYVGETEIENAIAELF